MNFQNYKSNEIPMKATMHTYLAEAKRATCTPNQTVLIIDQSYFSNV
jgi:hypothetical protein